MLDRLKEYKELIGIIVFFLAGFFWIENQFPSKTDLTAQLNVLRCEVKEYMSLTELQMKQSRLQNDLSSRNGQITALTNVSADPQHPIPAIREELEALRGQQSDTSMQLKQTADQIQKIIDDLGTQICQTS